MYKITRETFKFSKKHSKAILYHIINPNENPKLHNAIKGDVFYMIKFKDNGIKIGITKNFRIRYRSYKKPWCTQIEEILILSGNNIIQYLKDIEIEFKKKYCIYKGSSREYIDTRFSPLVFRNYLLKQFAYFLSKNLNRNYLKFKY